MNSGWLRDTIRDFEPYRVPEIKEHTVINANESSYNALDFPAVKAEFQRYLKQTPTYHYPDPFAEKLRKALADYAGCQPGEVLVGNGGDEIISLVMNTFLNPGDTILVHTPTFDIYGIDASIVGAKVVEVPDLPGFRRDCDTFLTKVKELQPKVTVLCNPNNPTGEILPLKYVEAVLDASPNPVLIDEAYLEFSSQDSIISKLSEHKNLIVIRTLSKAFGMAGLRVGYGVAQADVIDALSLTKLVYNMNVFSQIMALSVMAHSDEVLQHNIPPTIAARTWFMEELRKIDSVTVYPSVTNFVLVHVPDGPALIQALHEADICVRFYQSAQLHNCIRISVTTQDVMERVAAVFRKELTHA
ncbi:MAG: histidinol-phosphate transaminase [Megasphaera sp.]|jgi:histidinol-phosphate aminotransferase|nr:histidinol-phosphate transaminase [Megasphaera sp.]MCI1248621.1 histidinol-phosphate transaminase [Megasphaera sp.]